MIIQLLYLAIKLLRFQSLTLKFVFERSEKTLTKQINSKTTSQCVLVKIKNSSNYF